MWLVVLLYVYRSVKKSGYPDVNCTYRITDQELVMYYHPNVE